MPSVKWKLAFPQILGALARKGLPGDHGALEAHEQDRVGKKGGEEWGQLGRTNGGSHGIDHCCPMAPSVFGGLGSPLAGQAGLSLAVGSQDLSRVGVRGQGSSTDELKSKEDLFGRTSLAAAMPLWVGAEKGGKYSWAG